MDCSPWGRKESDITEVTWHAHTTYLRASLGAQYVKNPPAMQETSRNAIDQGSILGWKDALEEGIATHSSILAWRFLWTEEPGGLQSIELQKVGHD